MNSRTLILVAASLSLLSLVSCKPKQSAYKSVYEAAKEKELEEDDTTYVYEETTTTTTPRATATTSSNESVRREKVTPVNAGDASGLKNYSIVIAAMGMKPNAEALKQRMENAGYKTILVQNEQGMYRVIIASCDTKDEAVRRRAEILEDFHSEGDQAALRSKYGIPFNDWWILERAY